jgi:acetoin utilization deacetylase AcuC-like enzyme
MLVVYPERHRADHPTDREMPDYGRGFPELPDRVEVIKAALEETGLAEFVSPTDFGLAPIEAVHDAGLLDHLRTGYANSRTGPKDVHPYIAHTFAVRGRRNGAGDHPSAFGSWAFDTGCPLFERTWDAAVAASHAALTAAEHVRTNGGTAYALARPPGHHAGRDFYGGFCYTNHCAVAAEYLKQKTGGPVATLDFDYHHGNGTQEIFYADPAVLTCSLHADPRQDYPFYWGAADEIGEGKGKGFNLNVPLPLGTKDAEYLDALDGVIARIRDFKPNALVVSAGFDLMAGDPVSRGGGFKITVPGLKRIAGKIAELGLPTVLVQEGGYNRERLGEYGAAMVKSFSSVTSANPVPAPAAPARAAVGR